MRYILLIYENESSAATRSEEEGKKNFGEWMAYDEAMRKAGVKLAGEPLEPTPTATTIRLDGEKVVPTDGPFAETKEQLGGYYIIEAKDLDEATEWAARMPHLGAGGSAEIRPVMELG